MISKGSDKSFINFTVINFIMACDFSTNKKKNSNNGGNLWK